MPDAATRITPAEAAALILAALRPLPTARVPLRAARGLVLADDVRSPVDVPRWDNAAMDGYACRRADLVPAEVTLRVVEEIAAGAFPTRGIGDGECARIFTGAPVPHGADTVIRQEDATPLDGGRVRIDDRRDAGRNVRPRGEDVARDAVALAAGTELRAAQVGVLASIAAERVAVHRRPRVAVLTSGDELAGLDERAAILEGKKIASSNSYTLHALVEEAGGQCVDLGIARDEPNDIRQRLAGAADADLLVTSGAMSVGAHDHLRVLLEETGSGMRFWRLRARPGAPVGFGLWNGVPWIGLPGNPVSTLVTAELFVRPAIRKLLGHARLFRRAVPVRLAERIETAPRLQHFLRVTLAEEGGGGALVARLTGPQGSGLLTSMAKADALLIVPEEREAVNEGDVLPAMRLDEMLHREEPPY